MITFPILDIFKGFKANLKSIWNIRLVYHEFIGITIGYLFLLVFAFNTISFPLSQPTNYLCGFIGFLPALIVCALWDKWQENKYGAPISYLKWFLTGLAGVLGGYLEMIYPNWIVAIILSGISVTLVFKHYKE